MVQMLPKTLQMNQMVLKNDLKIKLSQKIKKGNLEYLKEDKKSKEMRVKKRYFIFKFLFELIF